MHQLGLILVEDSGHKVGTVLGSLTGPKVVHYLTPMWIASHSDEICGFFVFLHNSHAIQEAGIVPARAANMAGGENLLTKPSRPMVIGEDSIRSGYYMLPGSLNHMHRRINAQAISRLAGPDWLDACICMQIHSVLLAMSVMVE